MLTNCINIKATAHKIRSDRNKDERVSDSNIELRKIMHNPTEKCSFVKWENKVVHEFPTRCIEVPCGNAVNGQNQNHQISSLIEAHVGCYDFRIFSTLFLILPVDIIDTASA